MDCKVIFVTGLSGAGRTTALKILEDLDYEAVDNLPSSLLPLVITKNLKNNIAVGIDIRSRDFDGKKITEFINKNKKKISISVIFFECENSILIQRFKETRRRHPLMLNIPINDIIEQERTWLSPLKKTADFIIDTSSLEIPGLNKTINSIFSQKKIQKFNLRIISFGFKNGLPREADIIFDVRFLENPYYKKNLKVLNGKDKKVIEFVENQTKFDFFIKNFFKLIKRIIPSYQLEGKKYLTIAFGCTGGIHRSVVAAEKLFKLISSNEVNLFIDHRDINKWLVL